MNSETRPYTFSTAISVLLHGILLFFILFKLELTSKPPVIKQADTIVKAVSVNQEAVEQEISKLEAQKREKQEADLAEKLKIQKEIARANQQRQEEAAKLAKLKETLQIQQQKQLEAQKVQQKKLEELQQQQAKETEKLAALKKAQEELAKQKVAQQEKPKVEKNEKKTDEKPKAVEKEKTAKKVTESVKKESRKDMDELLKQIDKEEAEKEAATTRKKSLAQKNQPDAKSTEGGGQKDAKPSAAMMGELNKYKRLILEAIAQQWRIPEDTDPSLFCELLIKVAPNGEVLNVSLLKSSGSGLLDRSALLAVRKASPLPVPKEPEVFNRFREFSLTVRPESLLSDA